MDMDKRRRLIDEYDEESNSLVPIAQFFDGNDDPASIGCNLLDHPGIDAFRTTFLQIADRNDVEAVYAAISELDPGEDFWPFTDTIYVVGSISGETLAKLVEHLEPDEVGPVPGEYLPSALRELGKPVLMVWWD